MASEITIRLGDRAPKRPLKGLPGTITLPATATVEEIKKSIAKSTGLRDHHRVGLFDPETKKTFKDRAAKAGDVQAALGGGELLVKDLGLQIPWRTVFVIEYVGPLIFHPLALLVRPFVLPLVYDSVPPLSATQWLAFGMITLHFVKRELETLFLHRFSAATMPAWNVVRNSAFYWAIAGFLASVFIYLPGSLAASAADASWLNIVGVLLYVFGELSNLAVHVNLASLRRPGSTERKIPTGYGFGLVTCPNYMFEIIAWIGVILVSRSWTIVLFIFFGALYMRAWAIAKEKAYRQQFGDKYKKHRYVMFWPIV